MIHQQSYQMETVAVDTTPVEVISTKDDFDADRMTSQELFFFVSTIMKGQNIHKKRPEVPFNSRIQVLISESLKVNQANGLLDKTMKAFTIPDNDKRSLYRKMVRVALLLHPDIVDSQNLLLNTMFFQTSKGALAGMWVQEARLASFLFSHPDLKDKTDDINHYLMSKTYERRKMAIHKFIPARFDNIVEHPTLLKNGRKIWVHAFDKNDLPNRFRVLQYLKEHEDMWIDDQRTPEIYEALIPLWK